MVKEGDVVANLDGSLGDFGGHPFFGAAGILNAHSLRPWDAWTRSPCSLLVLGMRQFNAFQHNVPDFKQRLFDFSEARRRQWELETGRELPSVAINEGSRVGSRAGSTASSRITSQRGSRVQSPRAQGPGAAANAQPASQKRSAQPPAPVQAQARRSSESGLTAPPPLPPGGGAKKEEARPSTKAPSKGPSSSSVSLEAALTMQAGMRGMLTRRSWKTKKDLQSMRSVETSIDTLKEMDNSSKRHGSSPPSPNAKR